MTYKQILIVAAGSMLALAQPPGARLSYRVVDLGPVGNAPGSPYFIANRGSVAGAVETGGTVHAVVWSGRQVIDLGGLGGPNSQAFGVNNRGEVVGEAQSFETNGEDFCGFNAFGLVPSANACKAFLWQNGAVTELSNTLGGVNAVANQINNSGDVVGFAETNQPKEAGCAVGRFAPVIWRNGSMRALATYSGDPDGAGFAINENGQAVGTTGRCAPFNVNSQLSLLESHATLWNAHGSVYLIPGFGGDGGFAGNHACGINNLGQVVGHSDEIDDKSFTGFFWSKDTGTARLYPFAGDFASLAIGINDRGQVVGASLDADFVPRAMLWPDGAENNGMGIDLNTLVPEDSPLYLLGAFSINAKGEIAGFGVTNDGNLHGFLATPNNGEDNQQMRSSTKGRAIPVALSGNARRLLFQRFGIRKR